MAHSSSLLSIHSLLPKLGFIPQWLIDAEKKHQKEKVAPHVDFSDLFTGHGFPIPQTEMRAISLKQLDLVMSHVTRRLTGGEVWNVTRFQNGQMVAKDLIDPSAAQLYDVSSNVIVLATEALQLSLVEAMASSPQKPDFFVSHWLTLHQAC